MDEHSFIRAIHKQLHADLYHWKIRDSYTSGIPDTFYAGPKAILFIEYKFVKLPKRSTTLIKCNLSRLQNQWLKQMDRFNVPVAVVIGTDHKHLILEKGVWEKTFFKESFEQGITIKEIADWIYRRTYQ